MSKPHLAIQNQAVKYAQKDMNGDDIVQYDYIAVDLRLILDYDNTSYELIMYGLCMDIKDNYKKLPNRDDLTPTDIIKWVTKLMNSQNIHAYLTGNNMSNEPVRVDYYNATNSLSVAHLNGDAIIDGVEPPHTTLDSAYISINPLTDNINFYEV